MSKQASVISSAESKISADNIEIILDKGAELPAKLKELEKTFFNFFHKDQINITLNMKNINLAPSRFIVLLIKATSQARRLGGDIKLINLNPMVRNGFVTFTPNTFLTYEPSEKYALSDFGETIELDNEFDSEDNNQQQESSKKEQPEEKTSTEEQPQSEEILSTLQTLTLNDSNKVRVKSSAGNLYQICDFVVLRAKKAGFDEHELTRIKVTVYEASLNAVEHSYFSNPDYWIDVYAVYKNEKFFIIIHDWGRSFKFDPNREYNVETAVKERRTGGFGLHIIKRSVDEIHYLSDQKVGNRLVLIKTKKNKL